MIVIVVEIYRYKMAAQYFLQDLLFIIASPTINVLLSHGIIHSSLPVTGVNVGIPTLLSLSLPHDRLNQTRTVT